MKNLFLWGAVLLLTLSGLPSANAHEFPYKRACFMGEPLCVEFVIKEMELRYRPLAQQCDHDALFALAYLRTTEAFLEAFDEVGYDDPVAVIREDALFAKYYFRAYDAYHLGMGDFRADNAYHWNRGKVPPAWQVAFNAAQSRSVSGSGNLILGFNAHIQRDLPFVLYELYLQGRLVSYEDHNRINEFLQNVNFLQELAQKFEPTIDDEDVPGKEDDLQRFQLIAQWRELAYRNFERLRDADTDAARAQVAAEIEAYAAQSAELLRQAFSYPPGTDSSERDAYCKAQ